MRTAREHRLARHRAEMELAVAEGWPLDRARIELERQRQAARTRASASVAAPVPAGPAGHAEPEQSPFWWMRD
jgi:hypothetical protein